MKKKLSLLMVALVAIAAFAVQQVAKRAPSEQSFTITFKDTGTTNDGTARRSTIADIIASGEEYVSEIASADNVYNARSERGLKFGTSTKAGTLVMTLAEPVKPTKIVFKARAYNVTETSITVNTLDVTELTQDFDEYTVNYDGNTEISEISISTPKRAYITEVKVYYMWEAPAVAKPVIAGETPFLGTTNVTITCATEGAAIHYTTDGTAPTAESTAYTEPFAINATTTVKAIAVKDADQSEVAEKTFTAMEGTATLAELNALENGATFGYTGEAKVVAKPTANHVYVTDASGAALIYDASGENTTAAEVGKTIAANWTGKVSIYNQLTELVPDAALVMKDGDAVAVEYPEVAAADMIAENVNRVVTLKGITGYAVDGKNITITIGETPVVGYNQFGLEIAPAEEGKTYEMVGAISRFKETIQFQPISIARTPDVVDVTVDAADITGDITAALNAKTTAITEAGDIVGNITINLAAGDYTVSAPIVAGGNVVINGNGATIDASALAGNFIEMAATYDQTDQTATPTEWTVADIAVKNVTIKGLKKALFYSTQKMYVANDFTIDNCVVEQAADAITFDYTKGSTAVNFTVTNSTFYAPTATTKSFYSSQNGQKTTEYNGEAVQTFTFTNNTMYNLASGKNFFTHRQNSQKWLKFVAKNNIFVNCGKSGQTIKGMNGGGVSTNPQFDIDGNVFNYGGADTGAAEETGDADEPIQTTIAGVVTFTDAAAGNFDAVLGTEFAPVKPTIAVGDPRWIVNTKQIPVDITIGATELEAAANDISAALATAATGKIVGNLTINLAADGAYTISAPIEAGASVMINGAAGATIDASANTTGAFIQMSKTPSAEKITANNQDTYCVSNVSINNVTINDVKGSLFYDNNIKYRVDDFTIDNVVVKLNESAVNWESVIAFQAGGSKAFTIKNSTVYGTGTNVSKYFFRYASNGRLDRLGYDKNTEIQSWTYTNNTFYNLLKSDGQWGNGQNGQSYMAYYVENNIWYNCGDANQSILSRLGFGRIATEHKSFVKNTFFNGDKDNSVKETLETDALTTAPGFKDAANGDFAIASHSAQAKAEGGQTGDARWGTWEAGYAITVSKEIENGTVTVDKPYAAKDAEVTLTITPAEGYELDAVSVKGVTSNIAVVVTDGKFTMPDDDVTVNATFKAIKFYIIGDMNGWDRTAMTEMTFNAEKHAFEYEYAPTTTAYFAFADYQMSEAEAAAEGSWDVFNSTYRYSLGRTSDTDPNVEVSPSETALTLIKGVEGTIKLNPGTYKISVAKDFSTVTITGTVYEPTYTVAGAFVVGEDNQASFFGTAWEPSVASNDMKKQEDGTYKKVYEGVEFTEAGVIQFKVCLDHSWSTCYGWNATPENPNGENAFYEITTPMTNCTITITFNPNAEGNDKVAIAVTGTPTGINAVKADALQDAQIYTISGQRVDKAQKGLYIVNGKKVVIK